MKLEAAGSPNNENELEEFHFNLVSNSGGFTLRLVKFTRYTRENETDDWQAIGFYSFPDLAHVSTLPCPDVPAWAIADAKTSLLQHITFQP